MPARMWGFRGRKKGSVFSLTKAGELRRRIKNPLTSIAHPFENNWEIILENNSPKNEKPTKAGELEGRGGGHSDGNVIIAGGEEEEGVCGGGGGEGGGCVEVGVAEAILYGPGKYWKRNR